MITERSRHLTGGSWEALTWAKKTRVGNHVDKLILILMAEKVNERFELYPAKKDLAYDCEMAKSTLDAAQQRLADAGLITIVERLRHNGAQGRTTMLVNHPDAPHMNGEPIVLDFQGRKLEMTDLYGSGALEKFAAGVILLNKVMDEDADGNPIPSEFVDFDIRKNRFGQNDVTVRMLADLSRQRFEELSQG